MNALHYNEVTHEVEGEEESEPDQEIIDEHKDQE